MNEILIPEWIKREKNKRESDSAFRIAERQKQLIESIAIQNAAPDFFRKLLKEIALNTDALPEIGLRGKISKISNSGDEETYRIEVALVGFNPSQTYTDISYVKRSPAIQCRTQEGKTIQLVFCVHPQEGMGVVSNDRFLPMTPPEAAQMIVEQMAAMVRH